MKIRKKKKKTYQKEEDPNKGKYRDRAKERRQGSNADYDETADQTSEQLSEEQTKYLGGDIEHTHLVKGLDFSLLQKARSQMQQQDESKYENELEQKLEQATANTSNNTKESNSSIMANATAEYSKLEKDHKIRTAVAKGIYKALFEKNSERISNSQFLGESSGMGFGGGVASLFQSGRTSYVFTLEENSKQDIPTTYSRSKADCPVVEEKIIYKIHDSILQKVVKIMTYVKQGSGKKKLKKKKKPAENIQASEVEDMEEATVKKRRRHGNR